MDSSTNGAGSRTLWSEYRLRVATDAAGIALWSWNVDTDRITMDERAFEIWGLPKRDEITFEELSSCIHPADLDKVRLAFSATRELLGAYEIDFRILHGTEVRWIGDARKSHTEATHRLRDSSGHPRRSRFDAPQNARQITIT